MTIGSTVWKVVKDVAGKKCFVVTQTKQEDKALLKDIQLYVHDALHTVRSAPVRNEDGQYFTCSIVLRVLANRILGVLKDTDVQVYVFSLDPCEFSEAGKLPVGKAEKAYTAKARAHQQRNATPLPPLPAGRTSYFEDNEPLLGDMNAIFSVPRARRELYAYMTEYFCSNDFRARLPPGKSVIISGGLGLDLKLVVPQCATQEEVIELDYIDPAVICEGDLDVLRWVLKLPGNVIIESGDGDVLLHTLMQSRNIMMLDPKRRVYFRTRRSANAADIKKITPEMENAVLQIFEKENGASSSSSSSSSFGEPQRYPTMKMVGGAIEVTLEPKEEKEGTGLSYLDPSLPPPPTPPPNKRKREFQPLSMENATSKAQRTTTTSSSPSSSTTTSTTTTTTSSSAKKPRARTKINWVNQYVNVGKMRKEIIRASAHDDIQSPVEDLVIATIIATGKHDFFYRKSVLHGVGEEAAMLAYIMWQHKIGPLCQVFRRPGTEDGEPHHHVYRINCRAVNRYIKFCYYMFVQKQMLKKNQLSDAEVSDTEPLLTVMKKAKEMRARKMKLVEKTILKDCGKESAALDPKYRLTAGCAQLAWMMQYSGNGAIQEVDLIPGVSVDPETGLSKYGYTSDGYTLVIENLGALYMEC